MSSLPALTLFVAAHRVLSFSSRSEEDEIEQDGHKLGLKNLWAYLCRVMHNRRSKQDPLWNSLVVGGFQDGKRCDSDVLPWRPARAHNCAPGGSFLATVDLIGTAFEDDVIATG